MVSFLILAQMLYYSCHFCHSVIINSKVYMYVCGGWLESIAYYFPPHSTHQTTTMPRDISITACVPHQQRSGSYVAFLQLSHRPPERLMSAIKDTGNRYRLGPPGLGSGWHIHDPREVARRVNKGWPQLAKELLKVDRVIRHHSERVSSQTGKLASLDVLPRAALGDKQNGRPGLSRIEKL
jgi:hypothetical protein